MSYATKLYTFLGRRDSTASHGISFHCLFTMVATKKVWPKLMDTTFQERDVIHCSPARRSGRKLLG
jgi:hypothetical protein